MQTPDATAANVEKIAALFPHCVTEHTDGNGQTVRGIDFRKLRDKLLAAIEQRGIDGKQVFMVGGNYLIACFDSGISKSTITAIAKMKPRYFVMRDSSMASDNVADNFDQLFRHYSKGTVRRII